MNRVLKCNALFTLNLISNLVSASANVSAKFQIIAFEPFGSFAPISEYLYAIMGGSKARARKRTAHANGDSSPLSCKQFF